MFGSKRLVLLFVALMIGVSTSACNVNFERNDDGTWTVTANVTEAEMQDDLTAVIADPSIKNVQADFKDGYILATAEKESLDGAITYAVTFRVDVGIVEGKMSIVISNFQVDGVPVEEARLTLWNQQLANRLEARRNRRGDNSTLTTVTITEDDMTLVWIAQGRRGS